MGMKKKKEHHVNGINPAEVLDKVQSTLGMTIPKIPPDETTNSYCEQEADASNASVLSMKK